METNEYSTRQALDDAAAMRRRAAERVRTPPWYHPAVGLLMALVVGQLGFDTPFWVTIGLLAVTLVAAVFLVRAYTARTGVWVGPDQYGPRSRPVYRAFVLVNGALVLVALVGRYALHNPWPALVAGGVSVVAAVVLGRLLDSRLRDDIAAGQAGAPR